MKKVYALQPKRKAVDTTTVQFNFDSTATQPRSLRPFDDLRYDWAAALLPK